jgi:uroporphyrinogen-III synthase
MFEPMLLWVTRSAPYNLLTGHRLRGIGHSVLTVPVLRVRRAQAGSRHPQPEVLAFTSAHGVEHHPFNIRWAGRPVFAVGDHTAEAARRAGYRDVRSARGDVRDLQNLIVTTVPRPSFIVHFCAREPAGDLVGYLRQSGYEASRQVVYETQPAADIDLQHAVSSMPMLDGIVVHSPKAARRVAEVVASSGWYGIIFCVSPACASEFRALPGLLLETAPRPTEESLMNVLRLYRGRAISTPGRAHQPATRVPSRNIRIGAPLQVQAVANDNIGAAAHPRFRPGIELPEDPDDPPPAAA